MTKRFIVLAIVFGFSAAASAGTIKLKTGEKIEGTVTEDRDQKVVVDVDGRLVTIDWADIREITHPVNSEPLVLKETPSRSRPPAPPPEGLPALAGKVVPAVPAGPETACGDPRAIRLGSRISDVPGLKYLSTDPANGADVYVFAADGDDQKTDGGASARYYFWKDVYYKMHRTVRNKEEWRELQRQCLDRYGPGYHLEGTKDVHQWEDGDLAFLLRFDADVQSGYFETEYRPVAQKVNIRDSSGLQTLIRELDDDLTDNRVRAATSLGMMGDDRATMPLVHLLKDKNFIVRYNVALALGDIKDTRAVGPLIHALEDKDGLVRSFAAEALGKIGDRRAIGPLIDHVGENEAVPEALTALTGQHLGDEQANWREWWARQNGMKGKAAAGPERGTSP